MITSLDINKYNLNLPREDSRGLNLPSTQQKDTSPKIFTPKFSFSYALILAGQVFVGALSEWLTQKQQRKIENNSLQNNYQSQESEISSNLSFDGPSDGIKTKKRTGTSQIKASQNDQVDNQFQRVKTLQAEFDQKEVHRPPEKKVFSSVSFPLMSEQVRVEHDPLSYRALLSSGRRFEHLRKNIELIRCGLASPEVMERELRSEKLREEV
jgi:hypothetical protein